MELKSGKSRTGSVIAGGYDEFFTPLGGDGCDAAGDSAAGRRRSSSKTRQPRSVDGRRRSTRSSGGHKSVLHRRSVHGPESGVGVAGGTGDRVKSTVSGFLNVDYYSSNNSIPLVGVSESFTRLFYHTSDEDTDSDVEEFTEKKYGTEAKNLKDALKLSRNIRKSATGIPRMEGHMRLPDRISAPVEPADKRLYMGTSYLVEVLLRLERSTRTLTRTAIAKATDDERSRRVAQLRTGGAAVSQVWLQVQGELRQSAQLAEQDDNEAVIAGSQDSESHMQLVREQLVRQVHRRTMRVELQEAQQWKLMFFVGVSKNKLPADVMEVVASASEYLGSVLQELVEAFSCSQLDGSTRDEAVVERSTDIKDACLSELMRSVVMHKINIEVTIETQRQVKEFRRGKPVAAQQVSTASGHSPDDGKRAVGDALHKVFKRVDDRELRRENRTVDRVSEFKCICQEEIVRKVWQRKVVVLCNHEKARRIMEADDPATMDDEQRMVAADNWVRVQAQMIVDRFRGSKPTRKTSVTEVLQQDDGGPSPIYTALDRRLRAVRQRFRRPAVYFCDEDDTFVRERARRRVSLSPHSGGRRASRGSGGSSSSGRRAASRSSGRSRSGHSSPHASRSPGRSRDHRTSPEPATERRKSTAARIAVVRSSNRLSASVARGPSRHSKQATLGPSRHSKPATRSSDGHSKPATRSSDGHSKPATRSPDRYSKPATRSPDRHSKPATRSPDRHSKPATRSPDRHSKLATRSPDRHSKPATRSPDRHSKSASRSPSRHSKSASRSPSRHSKSASRSPGRQSITAPSPAARRSSSYLSARSTGREAGPGRSRQPHGRSATQTVRDVSPPSILKKPSGRSGAQDRTAGRETTGRRAAGASGEFREVVSPRPLWPEQEGSAAGKQYRRRGDKTEKFIEERRAIAERRQHERNERSERKSASPPNTTDQFRSHWTAHIDG